MKPFTNEELLDFTNLKVLAETKKALVDVETQFGEIYPLIIDGKKIFTKENIVSYNPSEKTQIVGMFSKGSQKHAEMALLAAEKSFISWSKVSPQKRAEYLFKAADEVRRRRYEINAWMTLEVGKNYLEADADTCEGIDFLEYYGREMLKFSQSPKMYQLPGEHDEFIYFPLGVGVIISPWNFPFAILIGMTSAAIVAGNTVVVKPSSDSLGIATIMMEVWEAVRLPKGVVNFVTGSGEEVGDYLVSHSKTRFVSFTGSRDVGIRINELAAKHQQGQKWIKRVVLEMGGKNATIVLDDADIDAAVAGVIAASFGFQGQKCSACSRVIVTESVYDEFVTRLKKAVYAIKIGSAKDNFAVGPVVNDRAMKKILSYIEIGKHEGKLLIGGEKTSQNGYFIEPTVFIDVEPSARIAQEEIFGPVVAVIKATNYDRALDIANNTDYGLTGAVFTKSKKNIERAINDFHCGNLYINRKSTGAVVGVHPFGGFNLSGTNSKAGGPDYLLNFLQGKSIGEKIL